MKKRTRQEVKPELVVCAFNGCKVYYDNLTELTKSSNRSQIWFYGRCPRCKYEFAILAQNKKQAFEYWAGRMMRLIWKKIDKANGVIPVRGGEYLWKFKDGIVREGFLKNAKDIEIGTETQPQLLSNVVAFCKVMEF